MVNVIASVDVVAPVAPVSALPEPVLPEPVPSSPVPPPQAIAHEHSHIPRRRFFMAHSGATSVRQARQTASTSNSAS